MAILTLEKVRAYRTLRGAFLISENGIAHFKRASRLVDTMRLFLSWMAILTSENASRWIDIWRLFLS